MFLNVLKCMFVMYYNLHSFGREFQLLITPYLLTVVNNWKI